MMPVGLDAGAWQSAPAIELRGERPGWQDWARAAGTKAPKPGGLSVDSMGHALRAARLGQGVVLGSKVLARSMLATGQLALVDAPELTCTDGYWLTWPDSFTASRRRRRLVEDLIEALGQP
jgi:LysR family glycine cleavage system transcriptional activator